jgi:cell division protein FtsI/penicillin-binding protein 2
LESGEYTRVYRYPDLGPIAGYNNPIYGLSGLEDSIDPYLRGTIGNPILNVWWNRLLYGQPPPGSDIRLSLDLDLQRIADRLLSGHRGALVLLNANSGEILVMASHPTFNANELEEVWGDLVQDEEAPLINRSALGQYPVGAAMGPFVLTQSLESDVLPPVPSQLSYELDGTILSCASEPVGQEWGDVIAAGCPNPV